MFKVGDKIVCFDDGRIDGQYILTKNNVYTVSGMQSFAQWGEDLIIVEGFNSFKFSQKRFVSLKEYRKNKLNKICLK